MESTNWSGGIVPTNTLNDTYDVIIQQTNKTGYVQVNLAQNAEINGLVLANALNVGYGSQGFEFHIRDRFDWKGGWLTGWDSEYHAHGNTYFDSPGALTLDRRCNLNLYSNAFWIAGYLNFSGYGQVVLHEAGNFRMLTPGYFGDAGSTAVADYINRGVTACAPTGGVVIVSSAFHNHGRLDIESGTFKIVNRFFGGGQVRVFPQGTLILNGWTTLLTNVQWSNDGYIELAPHNAIDAPSELRIPGHVALKSGGVDGEGDVVIDDWDWQGGVFYGTGRIEIPATGRLRRTGPGDSYSYRHINNSGTLQLATNASISVWNANLTNRAGAFLYLEGNSIVKGSGGLAATRIANEGLLRSSGAGLNGIGALFYNSGAIEIPTGQLQLAGGGSSSGQVQIGPTASLVIGGSGYIFEPASVCEGDGRIHVTSSATFQGALGTNLTLSGTQLRLERPYRLKELSLVRQPIGGTFLFSEETNVADVVMLQNTSLDGAGTTRCLIRLDIFPLELSNGHQLESFGIAHWTDGTVVIHDGSAWRNFGTLNLSNNAALSIAPGGTFASTGPIVPHPSVNRWSWSFDPFGTGISSSTNSGGISALGASGSVTVSNNSLTLGPDSRLAISDSSCFQTRLMVGSGAAWSLSSNLNCWSASLTNLGSIRVGGLMSVAYSQVRLAGTITAGQLRLTNSVLTGEGAITGNVSAVNSQFIAETATSSLTVHGSLAASNCVFGFKVMGTSNGVASSRISVAQQCSVSGRSGRFDLSLGSSVTIGTNAPVVLLAAGQPILGSFSNAPSGTLMILPGGQAIFRIFYGTNSPYGADKIVLAEAGTPFNVWIHNNFAGTNLMQAEIAGPLADADGNGLSNLHEFAFAIPHGSLDRSHLPVISRPAGAGYFDVKVTVRMNLGAVRVNVGFSQTLTNWVSYNPIVPGPVTLQSVSDSNDLRTFSYRYAASGDKAFVRTWVSSP